MESDDGFRSFSRAIETDPIGMLLAKWRRDVFIRKLKQLPDVVDVIPSGSLTRGTQIGPVHDVDLIVVFDKAKHPDYGIKGTTKEAKESAQAAITHLEGRLLEQLHPWRGAAGGLLKETEQRSHVVKYKGDWAGPFKEFIPSAPPVDVMPAVREGSHLLIPERGTGWIDVDPERLIRQVAQRQREWKYFTAVDRHGKGLGQAQSPEDEESCHRGDGPQVLPEARPFRDAVRRRCRREVLRGRLQGEHHKAARPVRAMRRNSDRA